jgi:hypothetical protein
MTYLCKFSFVALCFTATGCTFPNWHKTWLGRSHSTSSVSTGVQPSIAPSHACKWH